MQNLFPQMIQFNVPFIFTILIAVTAAAVTVFYYRRTNPEVSNAGKYALGVLRGSIIFLIILLFFAPRFLLQIRKVEKPKIAVFADNSLSMSNSESDSTRWDDEQAIVKRLENQLNSVGNISLYVFNDQVIPI